MTNKYKITIKRDWGTYGFWNPKTRQCEKIGFVVVKNGCNCMPGAVWFKTVAEAMRGIRAHINVGDCMEWYDEYKRLENVNG